LNQFSWKNATLRTELLKGGRVGEGEREKVVQSHENHEPFVCATQRAQFRGKLGLISGNHSWKKNAKEYAKRERERESDLFSDGIAFNP
jgi:hypothetical protein